MGKEKGWKRFDEIKGEDGQKYFIRVNKETGEFCCEIPNPDSSYRPLATFRNMDVNKVRSETLEWLKDNNGLKWEPIIVITGREKRWDNGGRGTGSEKHLELEYKRYFRAKRENGDYLWKQYDHDDSPGQPIAAIYVGDTKKAMRYSHELWLGLRSISELIKATNERIQKLIESNGLEAMLLAIASRGTRALLGPKGNIEVKA